MLTRSAPLREARHRRQDRTQSSLQTRSWNISANYLRPGGPFGRTCLPKDVRALQHISNDIGANTHVVDALMRSNEAHKHYLLARAIAGLEPGARVLMLGLAFKSDTDDLRESPQHRSCAKTDPGRLCGFNLQPLFEAGAADG